MATFRWRGNGAGTKSNWADGRNWVDETGAAYAEARFPGSIAATYDDVLFDAALATGAMSPAGYDGSANEILHSLKVSRDYNGVIGSASADLIIGFDTLVGSVNIDGTAAGDIYICSPAGGSLVGVSIIGGNVYLSGSIIGLTCLKGNITVTSGSEISSEFHIGYIVSSSETKVTVESGVTVLNFLGVGAMAKVTVTGGIIECSSAVNYGIEMFGGTWTQNANVGLLYIYNGTFYWNGGTMTGARIMGGLVDGSKSQQARTITSSQVFQGGTLNLDDGIGNITISNFIEVINGTLKVPAGTKLQRY